jgi:hypothetical protein
MASVAEMTADVDIKNDWWAKARGVLVQWTTLSMNTPSQQASPSA